MEVDRARAEKELRRHLAVAEALRDEARDLQLLRGQVASCAGLALPRPLAACAQFDPRPLGPEGRPKRLGAVECRSQVLVRLDAASGAAQELSKGELAARTLEGTRGAGVLVECRPKDTFGFALFLTEERAAVQGNSTCPGGPGALRPGLEPVEPGASGRVSPTRMA